MRPRRGQRGGGTWWTWCFPICDRRLGRAAARPNTVRAASGMLGLPPAFAGVDPTYNERRKPMAVKRLGIIMNGVTGRMGTNQHLVRSIVAIRREGGVALANGDRVMPDPDPGRPQRGEARRAGEGERHRALHDLSRQSPGRRERHGVLRCGHHADAARAAGQGHRCRQARLLREAGLHHPGGGAGDRAQGQGRRHPPWRGAGQAVPARSAGSSSC